METVQDLPPPKKDNDSLLKFTSSGSGQKHQHRNDDVNSSNEVHTFI